MSERAPADPLAADAVEALHARVEALRQRLAEADARDAERLAFLARFGHDLRNPVGALHAACALLRRLDMPAKAGPVLDAAERQLDAVGRLLDELRAAADEAG